MDTTNTNTNTNSNTDNTDNTINTDLSLSSQDQRQGQSTALVINNPQPDLPDIVMPNPIQMPIEEQILIPINPPLKQFTFTFLLLFLITTLTYVHSLFSSFDIHSYSLSLWPIQYKHQYYRIFINHFYHKGLFHYLTSIFFLYYITKRLENQIGTMYTLILIFHSILFISFTHIAWMYSLKRLIPMILFDFNFNSQCGLSGIVFTLYTLYYLLKDNRLRIVDLLFFSVNGIQSVFVMLFILQFITLNYSFIANLAGIEAAYASVYILAYVTFPKREWVKEFEVAYVNCGCGCKGNCCSWIGYVPLNENRMRDCAELSRMCNFKVRKGFNRMIQAIFGNSEYNDNNQHSSVVMNSTSNTNTNDVVPSSHANLNENNH